MTMLDRMRRHKGWLKWSLAVVVLTFVLLYIPDFVQTTPTGTGAGPREVIAEVDGRPLTAGDFQQRYLTQVQSYRTQLGGAVSDQLLRQLGIDRQILNQMIDEQVALIEAEQNGIRSATTSSHSRFSRYPRCRRTASSSVSSATSSCCSSRCRR
jgi:hypothetical protein